MPNEEQTEMLSFPAALRMILAGRRMGAKFMASSIFIEIQRPDGNSMNTEPYLKLVNMQDFPNADGSYPHVIQCEPWEPGRRSIFSMEWHVSKYDGIPFAQK